MGGTNYAMTAKYGLLWGGMALGTGIFVGEPFNVSFVAAVGAGALFGSFWLYKRGKWQAAFYCALFFAFCLGMGRAHIAEDLWREQSSFMAGSQGVYTVVVKEAPYIAAEGDYIRYTAKAEKVRFSDGVEKKLRGAIYVYTEGKEVVFAIGDRLHVTGRLTENRIYRNPGKIDFESRYKSAGIIGRIYGDKSDGVRIAEHTEAYGLTAWAEKMKENWKREFSEYVDPVRGSLLMTLLFGGGYENIPVEWMNAFSSTGMIHILSVSGSHIAILFAFLYFWGKWLHLPLRVILPFSLVIVGGYAALAGFVPPVMRAALMGLLSAGGLFFERDKTALNLLGAATIILLLWEPFWLYDVSFQLSVAASAGILLFYQPFVRMSEMIPHLPQSVGRGMALSGAAQVLTVPIVLWYFHVLPSYALIANLAALPFLEGAIVLGLTASLLLFFLPPLAGGLLYLTDYLLWGGIHLTLWMASWKGGSWLLGGWNTYQATAYYTIVFLLWRGKEICKRKIYMKAVGVILVLCVGIGIIGGDREEVRVFVPDVGGERAAALVSDRQSVIYYNRNDIYGGFGLRELQSFLTYQGLFEADVFIWSGSLPDGEWTSPWSLPLKELWIINAEGAKGQRGRVPMAAEKVIFIEKGLFRRGDWVCEVKGSDVFFRKDNMGVYLAGENAFLPPNVPEHILWVGGMPVSPTKEVWRQRLEPEAAVYAGRRFGEWEEMVEALRLVCPVADTNEVGAVAVGYDGMRWNIEE